MTSVDWTRHVSLVSRSLIPGGKLFKALELEKKRIQGG
jgi:hypothetical protein